MMVLGMVFVASLCTRRFYEVEAFGENSGSLAFEGATAIGNPKNVL